MKPEIISALQEFLRTFVFGMVVPVGAFLLVIKSGINVEVGGFNINWLLGASVLASGAISALNTAIVSAVDKFIHKNGISTPLDFKALDDLKK